MKLKLSFKALLITVILFTVIGCNRSEIDQLHSENSALKDKVASLQKQNADLKNDLERIKNPPDELYLTALNQEKENSLKKAKSNFTKIIDWYPNSPEAEKAKEHVKKIEEEDENLSILSDIAREVRSKFAGSTRAKLLSVEIDNDELIISAKHDRCDYYDVIFVDIGVAGYRSGDVKDLNFSKLVLDLQCGSNDQHEYYITKPVFLNYLGMSINDEQLINSIK